MCMNRVMSRARVLMVLVLVLALGVTFFLGEYLLNASKWVHSAGSPHIYNAENIGCGQIADREGEYRFDGEYTDILSGETFKEKIAFNPYELRILRKK